MILPTPALAQSDNFNSGTDAGWTRYDPLAPFGYSTAYSFPNGGYRIAAPGTGDPAVGPGRAGSLREDRVYSQFQVSVDLVAWDTSREQAIGLLSRITDPGLLTTDGYALTYSTVTRTLNLSRMHSEALTLLASAAVPDNSASALRLLFVGAGPDLAGEILDAARPSAPLASISTSDSTYDHGYNGLFVLDAGDGIHGADATFDNFVSPVLPGDADLDGKVDFSDLVILARHYGSAAADWSQGDFNADGTVNFSDLVALASHFGSEANSALATVPVPEPSILSFIAWLLIPAVGARKISMQSRQFQDRIPALC